MRLVSTCVILNPNKYVDESAKKIIFSMVKIIFLADSSIHIYPPDTEDMQIKGSKFRNPSSAAPQSETPTFPK